MVGLSIKQSFNLIVLIALIGFTLYCINQSIWFISYSPLPECTQSINRSNNQLIHREIEVANRHGYKLYEFFDKSINQSIDQSINQSAVVFVHGHRGSFQQGKWLASESLIQSNNRLHWFAVDFESNSWSAFHGQILIDQSIFLIGCLIKIDQLINPPLDDTGRYIDPIDRSINQPNNQIVIIGHSMGGIVARLAVNRLIHSSIDIPLVVTINTPHQSLPFYIHSSAHRLIDHLNEQTIEQSNNQPFILSISGGHGDHQIHADLTRLDQSISHSINLDYSGTINCISSHDSILNGPSINKAISRSIRIPLSHSLRESINQSVDQSINQSINQSIDQLEDLLTERWLLDRKQLVELAHIGDNQQSLNLPRQPSIADLSELSINQSIDQSIIQSVDVLPDKTHFHMNDQSLVLRSMNHSIEITMDGPVDRFAVVWFDTPASNLVVFEQSINQTINQASKQTIRLIAVSDQSCLLVARMTAQSPRHFLVRRTIDHSIKQSIRGIAKQVEFAQPNRHWLGLPAKRSINQPISDFVTHIQTLSLNLYPIKISLQNSIDQSIDQSNNQSDGILLFHAVIPSFESLTLPLTSPIVISVDPISQSNNNIHPYAVAMLIDTREPINQSVNQSYRVVIEPLGLIDRFIYRLVDHLSLIVPMLLAWLMIFQFMDQSIKQTNNQSINQIIKQSIKQSVSRLSSQLPVCLLLVVLFACVLIFINQSIDLSINQFYELVLGQSINRSMNQSIGQSVKPTFIELCGLLMISLGVVCMTRCLIECLIGLSNFIRSMYQSMMQSIKQSTKQSIQQSVNCFCCHVACQSINQLKAKISQSISHASKLVFAACAIVCLFEPMVCLIVFSILVIMTRIINQSNKQSIIQKTSHIEQSISTVLIDCSIIGCLMPWLILTFIDPSISRTLYQSIMHSDEQSINQSMNQSGYDIMILVMCIVFGWIQSVWLILRFNQSTIGPQYQPVSLTDDEFDDQSINRSIDQSMEATDLPAPSRSIKQPITQTSFRSINPSRYFQFCCLIILSLYMINQSIDLDICAAILMLNQSIFQSIEIVELLTRSHSSGGIHKLHEKV